ncbi:hypothetical protein F66182_12172, partial [Fusarium sp. NRRL 66182]
MRFSAGLPWILSLGAVVVGHGDDYDSDVCLPGWELRSNAHSGIKMQLGT